MSYMPQLDSLRAFAVFAVLVHHFLDWEKLPLGLGKINWGMLGVRLFFVLSGFLITGILMKTRDSSGTAPGDRPAGLRRFYARRFLRIFPLYYLVIGIALALNVGPVRELLPWLLTYTSNIYMAARGEWIHCFSHFWSLAVEEQYYLVWPWVVLFAPRRLLVPAIIAMIAIAPAFRLYAVASDLNIQALRCFTLALLDTLGAGSLLAIAVHSGVSKDKLQRYLNRVVLPAGLAGFALFQGMIVAGGALGQAGAVGLDLGASALFVWLIGSAAIGFGGGAGRLLECKPLVFTGRISYGIYVYHFFLPVAYAYVFPWLGHAPPQPGLFNLMLSSALAFAIAGLSWILFEAPVNRLKDKIGDTRQRARLAA
jgi:peptidoglycan/LPS O-acetylase OafA/YrhL